MEIYLDNCATTPVWPSVADKMKKALLENYGNPSSLHGKGMRAEKAVEEARRKVARLLGVGANNILFTSGGTEANNWAIWSASGSRRLPGRRVITTAIEHASVLKACERFKKDDFEVIYLPVNEEGFLDVKDLEKALCPETVLVSLGFVNNEIGCIQKLKEIGTLIKKRVPQALFHVDAVQGFAKVPLNPIDVKADIVTLSAHKMHGPKGVGALYLRESIKVKPFLVGGDQEKKLRAGTENVPGIVGFGEAAEKAARSREKITKKLILLKEKMREQLKRIPDSYLNGPSEAESSAPHILNVWFCGLDRGEVIVHTLEREGVYVSTGSACHSRINEASHVLKAIGAKNEALTGAVRISFSYFNTEEEVSLAGEAFQKAIKELRELF